MGETPNRRGIVVDDHLRTSVANIFATGDCIDKAIPKLTPTAEFESNYAAGQILGDTDPISYPATPHLVFTLPRIAQAGVTLASDFFRLEPGDVELVFTGCATHAVTFRERWL